MSDSTHDMSTLEKREEWYRTHECHPTSLEIANTIGRVQWLQLEDRERPFRRVLDIGCHDGFSTRWLLASPSLTYLLGVDLCESAITAARELAHGAPRNVWDYREIGFNEIPHKPGRFDVVVGFELIEHLEDEDARELVRVMHAQLCVGGRGYITTPHIDGPYGRSNPDPGHINLFDTEGLEKLLLEELEQEVLVRRVGDAIWAVWNKR